MIDQNQNIENQQSFTNELQIFIINELIKISKLEPNYHKAIPLIQSIFSETFHFVESQFFFENPQYSDLNKAAQSSEIFLAIIRSLVENGILDWMSEQDTVQILPNLDLATNEIFQKVLIYPLKRYSSNVFFVATLAPDSLLQNHKDLKNLPNVLELSLMTIMNAYLLDINVGQVNTTITNDSNYFKLVYAASRSNLYSFILQGLIIFSKAINAQLQFLVTDNEFSERRVKILKEYTSLTYNFLTKISQLQSNDYNPIKIDLKHLITEIVDVLNPICNTSEISISFRCDEDKYFIIADRNYLEIALFCIIINSIESIETSGTVSIVLQKTENKKISLSIIDAGVGISEIDLPQIFNPMWTTKDSKKHLGISLSFVGQYLNLINAKYSISSDLTKGTNFKIVFSSA